MRGRRLDWLTGSHWQEMSVISQPASGMNSVKQGILRRELGQSSISMAEDEGTYSTLGLAGEILGNSETDHRDSKGNGASLPHLGERVLNWAMKGRGQGRRREFEGAAAINSLARRHRRVCQGFVQAWASPQPLAMMSTPYDLRVKYPKG